VAFVEHDRRAQALIVANLAHCGVTTGYNIVGAGVLRAFESFENGAFDIILLDPPYAASDAEVAGVLASAGEIVAPHGVVVLERPRRRLSPDTAGRLERSRDVVSGQSALTFYLLPSNF
jgi:16S rRNA (guanine966-N2)-methyltransferase